MRIYPSDDLRSYLRQCMGATRFFYNKGVKYLNDNSEKNPSFIDLRKECLSSNKNLNEDEQWQSDIPYDTRQLALKDVIAARAACVSNIKNGNIDKFELKYKSRKMNTWMCHVDHRQIDFQRKKLFPSKKINNSFKVIRNDRKWWNKQSFDKMNNDFVVILEKPDKYYICFSLERKKPNKIDNENKVISLDPGVRTFQTFYDPDGTSGKIGDNVVEKIERKALLIDKLKSLITKCKNKRKKHNMKRRCLKSITKIKNTTKNLHWQTVSFLVNNYDNIILPEFNVKNMIERKYRKIRSNSVRGMLGLSHYKFKEKLKTKCKELGINLLIVNESWTSKTCGRCGSLNMKLGGQKVYKCKKCNYNTDRDINGARNILLRTLNELNYHKLMVHGCDEPVKLNSIEFKRKIE